MTPLQPRTRYEVQVAAFTSKGTGSYVGASVETIESPGNVVFCIAKGSVFSEWKKLVNNESTVGEIFNVSYIVVVEKNSQE